MGRIAVLSANLGGFDTPVEHVKQDIDVTFHTFTDEDLPPIADLPGRFQYRIPKLFGWQMFPGYDYYVWLDGSMQLTRPDSVSWMLGDNDLALFKHPTRNTVEEEVNHIDDYLNRRKGTTRGQDYIIRRYKNGLHKEQHEVIKQDSTFVDDKLYASTAFMYKNSQRVQKFLEEWWFHQSRYYTCDQIALAWLCHAWNLDVKALEGNVFNNKYLTIGSKHE